MKGLQFYKKEKQEKGAITLFVLLACLFFVFILTGVYLSNLNRLQVQEQEVQQIHDNYAKDIDRVEEIYEELAKSAIVTLRQEPSNGTWTKEVSLIGNAKIDEDSTATIISYIFNQQSTENGQSNWNWQAVTGSNVKELVDVTQSGITKNGTYYFWIKDSEGEVHRSNEVNVQNVDNNKPTAGTLIAKEQNEDGSEEDYDLDRSPWTDKDVNMCVFYKDSLFTLLPTNYLVMKYSDDGGLTWSDMNILGDFRDVDDRMVLFGPGVGTQIQNGQYAGRLLISAYNSVSGDYGYLYSDDHGDSWNYVDTSLGDSDMFAEAQIVELPDGTLQTYMRTNIGKIGYITSIDGGMTWSEIAYIPGIDVVSYGTQLSVIRHSQTYEGKSVLFLSTPTSGDDRRGGKILIGLVTDTGGAG